ncbi:MAG: hypothetical protein NHB14_21920 [Desulfosporosinus sp.]|nr:hypothetical protein [Desulfosporosinus sp.]
MNFNCKWNFSKITPLRIAILYGLTGWIWILFSDGLIALIISNQQELLKLSTLKGGFLS